MIKIKNFIWSQYEKATKLSKHIKRYTRDEIEEAVLGHSSRVKAVSNNKFIVLGKVNRKEKREYLFSVVHYLKKFTLFPIYTRPMNKVEREHYEEIQLYPYEEGAKHDDKSGV